MTSALDDPRWQEILEDRTHGASVLIDWTLEFLTGIPEVRNAELLLTEVEKTLSANHAGIPALINICNLLRAELQAEQTLKSAADALLKKRAEHKTSVILEAGKLISASPKVMSISYSGLVRDAILKARELGSHPTLFIGEGRPQNEGLLLAVELAQKGIETVVFTDIAFANFLKEVQLVIVGADAVFENSFINKVGTRILLDFARLNSVKTVLLYDFTKLVPPELKPREFQSHPEKEILGDFSPPQSLRVVNRYFEEIPISLIDLEIGKSGK